LGIEVLIDLTTLSSLVSLVSDILPRLREYLRLRRGFYVYESYYSVPWNRYIESSGRIDIVVYYLHSWIRTNTTSLGKFFRVNRGTIRLFLSDPKNIDDIVRFFPEYANNKTVLMSKIVNTKNLFLQQIGNDIADQIEQYYYPHTLSYAAFSFDDKILVLSFFEFKREGSIRSPAIVIRLDKLNTVKLFWKKEIRQLERLSRRVE